MSKSSSPMVSPLDATDRSIRDYFKSPTNLYQYITYEQFFKHFHINESIYKAENLNMIDTHLRYRWFVRQKMAPYKWIPILCLTPLLFHNFWLTLAIPYFTVEMFDHYFESFFVWRYKKERIINVRNEFVTKLTKETSKARRAKLFEELKQGLERKEEQERGVKLEHPIKYIKFGEFTEYIFHATVGDKEQSSILQTTIFETFLGLKDFLVGFNQFSILKEIFFDFIQDFKEFKKDSNRTKYLIDTSILIDRQDIKQTEVYTLQDNLDHNIRRLSQLWNYSVHNSLQPNEFRLWQYTNFSKFQDIFQPTLYNIKDNKADLLLYYSVLAVPKLLKILFKRR